MTTQNKIIAGGILLLVAGLLWYSKTNNNKAVSVLPEDKPVTAGMSQEEADKLAQEIYNAMGAMRAGKAKYVGDPITPMLNKLKAAGYKYDETINKNDKMGGAKFVG